MTSKYENLSKMIDHIMESLNNERAQPEMTVKELVELRESFKDLRRVADACVRTHARNQVRKLRTNAKKPRKPKPKS